jgi:hypothetical protein
MKVVTGQEHWIKEDIMVGIAGIAIGVDGVQLANVGGTLRGIVVVEREIVAAVSEEVTMINPTPSAAPSEVDAFPLRKGNNGRVESRL